MKLIPTHDDVVDYIDEHLTKTGERLSTFGRRVLGDSAAIPRLYEGSDPRLSTLNKIAKEIDSDC